MPPVNEQRYVAKFPVYMKPSGGCGCLTFEWGEDRFYFGTIAAPGEASISVFPPERLMVPRSVDFLQNVRLSVVDAIDAAKRGDHGLTWEPKTEDEPT